MPDMKRRWPRESGETRPQADEPVDPAAVEREVYEKLYGARSKEIRASLASQPEPKPKDRPRSKRTVGAERPAPSGAGQ